MHNIRQAARQLNFYQISAIAALAVFFTLIQTHSAQAFFVNVKPQPFQQALGVALSKEDHKAQNIAEETISMQESTPHEPAPEMLDLSDMIESLAWLSLPKFNEFSF